MNGLRQAMGRLVALAWMVVAAVGIPSAASAAEVRELTHGQTRDLPQLRLGLGGSMARPQLSGARFQPGEASVPLAQGGQQGFYSRHLLPGLTRQFSRFSAYQVVPEAGTPLGDYMMFDELADQARRRGERGTRRAVRDYLLEVTPVGRWMRSLESDVAGAAAAVAGGGGGEGAVGAERRRPVKFGVGVSHRLPRVEMRYRGGTTLMRLGLSADGSAKLSFDLGQERGSSSRAAVTIGYDADDHEYDLSCRIRLGR